MNGCDCRDRELAVASLDNTEEALSLAVRELQVSSAEDLGYRIVEQRRARLFSKPSVVIEAWVEACGPSEDDHPDERKVDFAIDGTSIRVKAPPEGEDVEPVAIWATFPVRLQVNGAGLRDGERRVTQRCHFS